MTKKNQKTIEQATEDDFQIVGDGMTNWAVMSKRGHFRFHDPHPVVIYAGLSTCEAAEVARQDALANFAENPHSPYPKNSVPLSYLNAVGRVVAKLRKDGVQTEDMVRLAVGIAEAAAGPDSSHGPFDRDKDGEEIPF